MMISKEKNFVSAVVYVHNSEKILESFLDTLVEILEKEFEHSEIICVNDCSNDGSLSIIKRVVMKIKNTCLSVVNMSYFHGLELAMGAGVDLAIGDFVFEFDNVIQDYDASEIMRVYKRTLEGYDIVSASADKRENFTSGLFYRIFDKYSEQKYELVSESFHMLSRRAINRVKAMNQSVFYRKALYAICGLKTDNIRYAVTNSKKRLLDSKEQKYRAGLAIDSLVLFTTFGYRFSLLMTGIMMLVSVFALAYTILTYCLSNPVEGWTTTILFLAIAFFGLFGILTIIIKYLQLLLGMVYKRQHYSYESVEKLTK